MNKLFFTLLLSLIAFTGFAQETAVYSQYQVFPILVNPGYTGFHERHEFVSNAKRTWTGFPGAPSNYSFIYHGPVGDRLALGAGAFAENIGNVNYAKLQLNYAFRFKVQKAQIGLGLSSEFIRSNANGELLNNPLVGPRDPVLENLINGQSIFDASLGVHVLYDNRFFVSLASPSTVRTRLDAIPGEEQQERGGLLRHYFLQLGYVIDIPKQDFRFIPSIAVRSLRNVPFQIDINMQGRFLNEKLITGITVRPNSSGSMAFILGSKVGQVQFLYSYDVSFSKFQQYNSGSHELSLAFMLRDKKAKPVEENPYK